MSVNTCTITVSFKPWPTPIRQIGFAVAFVAWKMTGKVPVWAIGKLKLAGHT